MHELLNFWGFLAKPLRILRGAIKDRRCLERLVSAGRCGLSGFRKQHIEFLFTELMKRVHGLECLIEDFHTVDARDHDGRGQIQGVMQALKPSSYDPV